MGLPPLWEKLRNQIYLGSEQFVARLQREIDASRPLTEVPRAQRRPVAKPLAYYADQHADPALAMAMAFRSGDYTLKAIGDYFGVHYTTVSRAVRAHEASKERALKDDSDNVSEAG